MPLNTPASNPPPPTSTIIQFTKLSPKTPQSPHKTNPPPTHLYVACQDSPPLRSSRHHHLLHIQPTKTNPTCTITMRAQIPPMATIRMKTQDTTAPIHSWKPHHHIATQHLSDDRLASEGNRVTSINLNKTITLSHPHIYTLNQTKTFISSPMHLAVAPNCTLK